jgi:hypothetical protein
MVRSWTARSNFSELISYSSCHRNWIKAADFNQKDCHLSLGYVDLLAAAGASVAPQNKWRAGNVGTVYSGKAAVRYLRLYSSRAFSFAHYSFMKNSFVFGFLPRFSQFEELVIVTVKGAFKPGIFFSPIFTSNIGETSTVAKSSSSY